MRHLVVMVMIIMECGNAFWKLLVHLIYRVTSQSDIAALWLVTLMVTPQ